MSKGIEYYLRRFALEKWVATEDHSLVETLRKFLDQLILERKEEEKEEERKYIFVTMGNEEEDTLTLKEALQYKERFEQILKYQTDKQHRDPELRTWIQSLITKEEREHARDFHHQTLMRHEIQPYTLEQLERMVRFRKQVHRYQALSKLGNIHPLYDSVFRYYTRAYALVLKFFVQQESLERSIKWWNAALFSQKHHEKEEKEKEWPQLQSSESKALVQSDSNRPQESLLRNMLEIPGISELVFDGLETSDVLRLGATEKRSVLSFAPTLHVTQAQEWEKFLIRTKFSGNSKLEALHLTNVRVSELNLSLFPKLKRLICDNCSFNTIRTNSEKTWREVKFLNSTKVYERNFLIRKFPSLEVLHVCKGAWHHSELEWFSADTTFPFLREFACEDSLSLAQFVLDRAPLVTHLDLKQMHGIRIPEQILSNLHSFKLEDAILHEATTLHANSFPRLQELYLKLGRNFSSSYSNSMLQILWSSIGSELQKCTLIDVQSKTTICLKECDQLKSLHLEGMFLYPQPEAILELPSQTLEHITYRNNQTPNLDWLALQNQSLRTLDFMYIIMTEPEQEVPHVLANILASCAHLQKLALELAGRLDSSLHISLSQPLTELALKFHMNSWQEDQIHPISCTFNGSVCTKLSCIFSGNDQPFEIREQQSSLVFGMDQNSLLKKEWEILDESKDSIAFPRLEHYVFQVFHIEIHSEFFPTFLRHAPQLQTLEASLNGGTFRMPKAHPSLESFSCKGVLSENFEESALIFASYPRLRSMDINMGIHVFVGWCPRLEHVSLSNSKNYQASLFEALDPSSVRTLSRETKTAYSKKELLFWKDLHRYTGLQRLDCSTNKWARLPSSAWNVLLNIPIVKLTRYFVEDVVIPATARIQNLTMFAPYLAIVDLQSPSVQFKTNIYAQDVHRGVHGYKDRMKTKYDRKYAFEYNAKTIDLDILNLNKKVLKNTF